MDAAAAVAALKEYEDYRKFNRLLYYEPYDFQKAFHHAEGGEAYHTGLFETHGGLLARIRALQAGNQCITWDTLIETEHGEKPVGEVFGKSIRVWSWNGKKKVLRPVLNWFVKPAEQAFRLNMADGRWIECTLNHRILTSEGYVACGQLLASLPIRSQTSLGISRSVHGEDGLHCSRTPRDYQDGYLAGCRLYGGRPLYGQDNGKVSFPLQADARQRTSCQKTAFGWSGQ
jgi:hypothetical protein